MEQLRVILQQLSITVNPVNDAPVAQDGSNTKEEDTDQTITLSASDVDGDDLTYTIGTAPTNGTVTLTGAKLYTHRMKTSTVQIALHLLPLMELLRVTLVQ